jgi:CDP-6-deoxy-D-xylo-4-hexulose-3-dehydrase
MKYPLATSSWDEAEGNAVSRVLESGQYTMGSMVRRFEKDFAEKAGSKYCVMVNSGSSANLLMIAALFYRKEDPLRSGEEAVVPAVSWPTTYYPLHQYGLRIKFVDIDLETLNYDLEALGRAVSGRTRLVVAVNLLGNPNDFDVVGRIASQAGAILVEDNCESLGAEFRNKKAGTFGLLGSFSFFFSHHMCTMEGGAVCTDDEELYHILLCLRAHGWTRNLPKVNRVTGIKSDDEFEESYRFILPGYNVRPLEVEAAAGIEQLQKLDSFLACRLRNAALFKELFGNNQSFGIQKEIGTSSWFGFSLVIRKDSGIRRDRVIDLLTKNEVECRPIVAGNFTKNPVIQYFNHEIAGELNNADWIDQNGFFVGNHHYDIAQNLHWLCKILKKA